MPFRPTCSSIRAQTSLVTQCAQTRPCITTLSTSLQHKHPLHPYLFHTSAHLRDDTSSQNHYQVLGVLPSASPAEIKKKFYALSKSHHPDLHPNDPKAPNRFVSLSTAYSVLSSPQKRASYDRDLARTDPSAFGSSSAGHGPRGGVAPSGSHSSAQAQGGPFSARPASGLSKKRGSFRGPPDSFYRSGGYGGQASKRRAAASGEGATMGARSSASAGGAAGGGFGGGFSPGQGEKYADSSDVPHFDREGHFRRQEGVDERARVRRQILAERLERQRESLEGGIWGRVTIVCFALGVAMLVARPWKTEESRKSKSAG